MIYYLGIDNGGTMVKAVLFDQRGCTVAEGKAYLVMEIPHKGWAERGMDTLWEANCAAIREVLQCAAIDPKDVRAVSFSGHGKGLYLIDEKGTPVRRGIVSTDTRASSVRLNWQEKGIAQKMAKITLQGLMACQPICLLKWLQQNEPEALEKTRWILGVKDYIRFRMTGDIHTEITDFSGSGLLNLNTRSYDERILKLADLTEVYEKLPPLAESAQAVGYVTAEAADQTGLAEGIVCAAGLFDIDACALGMGVTDGSRLAVIAGTWGINEYIATEPVVDGTAHMNSYYCLPGWYLLEESSPTSASNFEWLVQNFLKNEWELNHQAGESLYNYAVRIAAEIGVEIDLGTAMVAAVACGDRNDLAEAAAGMCRLRTVMMTDETKRIWYRARYKRYCEVAAHMAPFWTGRGEEAA